MIDSTGAEGEVEYTRNDGGRSLQRNGGGESNRITRGILSYVSPLYTCPKSESGETEQDFFLGRKTGEFWDPLTDVNEVLRQMADKKFREIHRHSLR